MVGYWGEGWEKDFDLVGCESVGLEDVGYDNAGERERAISRYPGVWVIRIVGGGGASGKEE